MNQRKSPARVIAITSGKGGVGKTHTTVNLGLALVKQGKKVLLLDGDLGLANINILLGFKPAKTLAEVIKGQAQLKEVIVTDSSGLDIIPAASGIPEVTNLSEAERLALINAFDQFAEEYDFVLVDTAAGIGDNVVYFNLAAEDIIVVINPEPTSITDAYALIKVLATRSNCKEFHILVNRNQKLQDPRSTFSQLAQATDRFLSVSLKFLGGIAEDESVSQAVVRQRPFGQLYPGAKASVDMQKLATKLISGERPKKPSGGLQFFFKSLLNSSGEAIAEQGGQ